MDSHQFIETSIRLACVRILPATGAVPNVAAALAKLVAAATVGPPLVARGAVCTPFAACTVFGPLAAPS